MAAKSSAVRTQRTDRNDASLNKDRDDRAKRAVAAARSPEPDATSLDRLIHERTRLAIISALAVNESLTFNELKTLLRVTDGNLSVHARKLEEAEYISCLKYFEGRVPRTEYRLTATGRRALTHYLNQMEEWIRLTREQD